jgi:hypothetical protein
MEPLEPSGRRSILRTTSSNPPNSLPLPQVQRDISPPPPLILLGLPYPPITLRSLFGWIHRIGFGQETAEDFLVEDSGLDDGRRTRYVYKLDVDLYAEQAGYRL